MKVLLVVYDNDSYIATFPTGIAYISSYLRKNGHHVEIYNQAINHNPDSHLTHYLNENEFDVVGVGIIGGYYQYRKLLAISRSINESKKKPFFVLGGHGPSPEPAYFMRKTGANAVVIGEGEDVIINLLTCLENNGSLGTVNGIAYLDSQGCCNINPRQNLIHDVDSIPFPDYDLFPIDIYRMGRQTGVGRTEFHLQMITGRGCTYNCNFCFSPETFVTTDVGNYSIENIVENNFGTKVLSHDGSWNKINQKFKRWYEGDIIEIKAAGCFPFKVTPNHKFFIDKGEKEARFLNVGDNLLITVPKENDNIKRIDIYSELKDINYVSIGKCKKINGDLNLIRKMLEEGKSNSYIYRATRVSRKTISKIKNNTFSENKKTNCYIMDIDGFLVFPFSKVKVKRYIDVDNDFCRLSGLFVAEGCVVKHNRRLNSYQITFNYSYREKALAEETKKLIKKCLGIYARVFRIGSSYRVCFSNKIIGLLFLKLFGHLANNKKFPYEWMSLPLEKLNTLFEGYFDGDGYRRNNTVEVSTTSPSLVSQVQIYSSRNNKHSCVKLMKKTNIIQGRKVNCKQAYYLCISNGEKFGGIKKPIVSVKKGHYCGYVYNLGVENVHSYSVNNLSAHNCYRMDKGFRPRSNDSILEEMWMLKKKYGITFFSFLDELLMSSPKRSIEFSEAVIKSGINVGWYCNGRLNHVTKDVIKIMKRAGCRYINYGIECFDDQILKNMNKHLTTDQIINGIELTLSEGITPGLNVIFGNIGENKDTLRKSMNFILKYSDNSEMRTIRPVTPYPGSPLYYYAIEKGLLKGPEDFYENKHLNSDLIAVNFTELSDDEFYKALSEANVKLIEKYFNDHKNECVNECKKFYEEKNVDFRGFRTV